MTCKFLVAFILSIPNKYNSNRGGKRHLFLFLQRSPQESLEVDAKERNMRGDRGLERRLFSKDTRFHESE